MLALVLGKLLVSYLRLRGKRVVTCPQAKEAAAVDLDAGFAALTALFKKPTLRLRDCSRWGENHECGRACLRQIEAAPEDCLVRRILTAWYQGKSCIYCGRPFEGINWMQHKPCLVSPGLRIFEWGEIQPEAIPQVLATHSPVCWTCNVAETHTW